MSNILILETSGPWLSVCIAHHGNVINSYQETESMRHAQKITTVISHLLETQGLSLRQLSAIAIDRGPGSFTGLRVASSTAKGLCMALDIPLIAINGLPNFAIQWSVQNQNRSVCMMIDARRNHHFYSYYDRNQNIVSEVAYAHIDEIILKTQSIQGIEMIHNLEPQHAAYFEAKQLAKVAHQCFENQIFESIAYFEPEYMLNNYQPNVKPIN